MKNRLLLAFSCLALSVAAAAPASATTLVANSGWNYDEVAAVNAASDLSPWTFTLTTSAVFSLVDGFIAGDVYTVYVDGVGTPVGTSTFYAGSATDVQTTINNIDSFSSDWVNASYSKLAVTLGPGTYAFDIQGNAGDNFPAGLGVRLDAVPEPATWMMFLLGFGILGFATRSRREGVAAAA